MKQLKKLKAYKYYKFFILLSIVFLTSSKMTLAQDSSASPTLMSISYFLPANHVPYLEITTKKKIGRKFEPVKGVPVNVYFSEATPENLLGKVTTAVNGKARLGLPPSFKATWNSLDVLSFVAESQLPANQEAVTADLTLKKAMLTVDTTISEEGGRMVTALIKEKSGDEWVPVEGVDIRLTVKRSLSNLSVGDDETYTSDSSGVSSADFKIDSIPGDEKGNITLLAKLDDNDTYGTLVTEKTVAWGSAASPVKNFFAQRTLWSTRFETPLWLLFTAYFIVITVWGTIFYLVFQMFKIVKLGKKVL